MFLFHSYAPNEYGANPQTWAVVQDARGVMFFANDDGVLEFDGATWRKIKVDGQFVRSLAIDSRGVIFVGGRGTFGYLSADATGDYRFVSLLNKVTAADQAFLDIWNVLPTADGVYFASYKRLFLYTSGGRMQVFRPAEKDTFNRAFTYHGEFFIGSEKRGLLSMQDGDLTESRIRSDRALLHSLLVFASGEIPVIGYGGKLYRFTLGSIDPFPTGADAYFKDHEIYCVSQLPSGDLAVGTKSGGLVLLKQNGELERIIRKTDGLPSNLVTAVYSDHQDNVWITTETGLARFPLNLTRFSESQGLHGSVYAVERIGGVLYVGTSLGLFEMRTVSHSEPTFFQVPGIQESVFFLGARSNLTFAGTEHGLFVLSNGKFDKIEPHLIHGVYDVASAKADPNIFYTAGVDGVHMLKHDGQNWKILQTQTAGQEFRSVTEARDGRVWATGLGSAWRIDFRSSPVRSERFKKENGIPGGFFYVDKFRNHPIFASTRGLLQFSETEKHFFPDAELGSRFAGSDVTISTVKEDPLGNVWITGNGYHGYLSGKNLDWLGSPLQEAQLDELFWISFDRDGTCWTAGAAGSLVRYQRPAGSQREFEMLLRSARLTNDERLIYGGDGTISPPRWQHRDNAIRFEYVAPFFEDESAIQYQYRLEGSDSKWSPWTKETRKDYTNLFEGKYQFQVRAQNPHGAVTQPASYRFVIDAPWYRTWLAYAVYVAAFLFAGWLILRWRLEALEARNRWLEGVVEERTAEVRTERDQNEALLLNILPKPIASELRTTGVVKPASFEDVTVCFSDFVGFTLSSEKLPPQELISSLNEYFTAFDEIIGRYGLEKLKTIGDAYMFAGGLPNASPSHAVDAVLAALEMVEVVRKLARPDKGVNWSIRLGLYSGPVVAGVVGVRKFAFDIWGSTVNFAARMESAGAANRVNLSQTTCQRVFDFIECEPRGPVRIKEGREMEMFFAVKPKSDLLGGPLVDGIPETFRQRYEEAFAKPPKAFPDLNGWHVE